MSRIFQPVLVRPGQVTRTGLAAHVAVVSWCASRQWTEPLRELWRGAGSLVSVRKAHLDDFRKMCSEPGWFGNDTAVAGPPMTLENAPARVQKAPSGGWHTWGTVEHGNHKVTVRVNSEAKLTDSQLATVAAKLLQEESSYTGAVVKVVEVPLGQRTLGEVLIG